MAQSIESSSEPVTAMFSWTVKADKEQVFEDMLHDIHKVARRFPGHMGVTTLQSPTNKGSFQTVLRFDTARHLEAWLNSPIRQKMMKPLEKIARVDKAAKATGLETWFEIPGQQTAPPPRWKMVVATFIAIYPLSLLFTVYVAPYVVDWPVWARSLFLPVIAPVVLTYVFMPFLTQRVLNRWLYKDQASQG
jgi:antibiotic biosynthesis monooxygenase (ABM) superfamily enzyme